MPEVVVQPGQQPKTPPPPFDKDRMIDVCDSQMEDYLADSNQSKEDGREDAVAIAGFDRTDSYRQVIAQTSSEGMTSQEYIDSLKANAERRAAELKEHPNDRRAAELKAISGTIRFLENDLAKPQINDLRVATYRQRQSEAAKSKLEGMKTADQTTATTQIDAVRKEAGLDREAEKRGLIDQVVKACGARVHTALPKSLSDSGYGGFYDKSSSKLSGKDNSGIKQKLEFLTGSNYYLSKHPEFKHTTIDQSMPRKGITEVLYIAPVEETVYENRTTYTEEKRGGVLGVGAKTVQVPKQERVASGTHELSTSDVVKNGDRTPCYRLVYSTTNNDPGDQKYHYQAQEQRFGQIFSAEIFLPKALAEKVSATVREDPAFLHRVIDAIATQDVGIPKDQWENGAGDANGHPLRPPYDKWRETDGGKSKLYMVEQSQIQAELDQGTVDFDPKFVINY